LEKTPPPATERLYQAPAAIEQRGPGQSPEAATPAPATEPVPATPPVPAQRGPVHLGPPSDRHPLAMEAIQDAEGPVLVITSSPEVWSETKDARAKLGPVLLYDPTHRCDTPARMHWNPAAGCTDKETATQRAAALLAPIRPTAKLDSALAEAADTLLRSYLHAAAVDGKPFRHVHRWAQGTQVQDAVRILRTNPKAAAGTAGELEAALTSHPERRDMAQELTARALSSLFSVHIREACTPNRTDALTLDSFVNEGGTLYVVGEPIEDPKGQPGAMPLLTALASSVVEHGRRVAARSPAGRLDPPMTFVLDDVAAVAPLPQLPELLSTGADRGLVTLALLRSREQGRTRWPDAELPLG
ncbi:type IV secretory system conjugative DNA transfer family protein, partial [Streptomyces sp. NPDC059897]|uniref:type IV secretory system conjugative DNA transfer family protein n=1 Tax=Streptomyces sp. NPDC059897 TaxID=3346994 RepID=UPI00365FF344